MLTLEEIDRYDRQARLGGWGAAGQERLKQATVRVDGRGAAAAFCAAYLAGAGVGRLFVDAGLVDEIAAQNPLVEARAIRPRVPVTPGQPEPDPPAPADPEHPDAPQPDAPGEEPTPEEPAIARVTIANAAAGGSEPRTLVVDPRAGDAEAVGAALAVEVVKAIIGLPHEPRVSLSLPSARS